MSSTYGEKIKLSIFGQSHGPAIGMTLDGIPAGLPVDTVKLQSFLNRRAPGQGSYATPRKEADAPEFLSGILNGYTCGAPIAAVIRNTNTRSKDYIDFKDTPRPGHADFTAQIKYGGFQDTAGGGHFSGRLTAPLCIAGGLCKQWLEAKGIRIGAHLICVEGVTDDGFDPMNPQLDQVRTDFPVLSEAAGARMQEVIAKASADGDSVGGIVECAITGLPAGLGEPMFGGMESRIAQIVYGIPAVKAVEFGAGYAAGYMRGSQHNDEYTVENGAIRPKTNRAGGILGGITTGLPVYFQVAFKPTPSISKQQQSASFSSLENVTMTVKGRHDPCVAPRAVPVVEAAAAITVFDLMIGG